MALKDYLDPKLPAPTLALCLFHLAQLALCARAARLSSTAIKNLRSYEDLTKSAANLSTPVENHLNTTIRTQLAGVLAINASFVAAGALFLHWRFHYPGWVTYTLGPVALVVVVGVRRYMSSYWGREKREGVMKKLELPDVNDYAVAAGKTEGLLRVFEYLEYSWLVGSLVAGMGAYGAGSGVRA